MTENAVTEKCCDMQNVGAQKNAVILSKLQRIVAGVFPSPEDLVPIASFSVTLYQAVNPQHFTSVMQPYSSDTASTVFFSLLMTQWKLEVVR